MGNFKAASKKASRNRRTWILWSYGRNVQLLEGKPERVKGFRITRKIFKR